MLKNRIETLRIQETGLLYRWRVEPRFILLSEGDFRKVKTLPVFNSN